MAEPDGVTVLAYIPRWPAVDRALHVALCHSNLAAEVVPLDTFLPAAEHGASSSLPDGHPLPNGTCLLLVRRGSGAGAPVCNEAPPETRARGGEIASGGIGGGGYGGGDYTLNPGRPGGTGLGDETAPGRVVQG
jgi:hypothetical protein